MRTIHVQLFDASTDQLLGEADLPVEQLPETFAKDTTLHLGGGDWHVESAQPMTREEFVASGQLRLVLRQIDYVDPKKLLFSLPTLENAMPPMLAGDPSHAFVMHEDDWRQHELVASRFEPEIAAELAQIRQVHAERSGPGFERLHVRELIPQPLEGVDLSFADVQRLLGDVARREVAFGGQDGVVAGGFAFVRGDGAVYGREEAGRVMVLGVSGPADAELLAPLAKQHSLVVVDWCRALMG